MKILHIVPNLEIGGAEKILATLIENRSKSNIKHYVISIFGSGPIIDRIQGYCEKIYFINLHKFNFFHFIITFIKIKDLKPNKIIGWMYNSSLLAVIINKIFFPKIPVIWCFRHSLYDKYHEKYSTRIIIQTLILFRKHVHKIVYNSLKSKQLHEAYGFKNINSDIIYNGYKSNIRFNNKSLDKRQLNPTKNLKFIGMIANYRTFKDHKNCIRAFKYIKEKYSNITLVLIGRDINSDNINLKKIIEDFELSDSIKLLGLVDDVYSYLKFFYFTILSSKSESFPNVIAESMIVGTPVVSTNVGDAKYIIGDSGYLVPPESPKLLAKSCIKMLQLNENIYNQMCINARNRIVKNFKLDTMVRKFETL